jgi:hypothetical protein
MLTRPVTGMQYAPPGLDIAQYISCYTIPGPKGSTQKISCDAHGNARNAHDPSLWSTAADVMTRPWRVGFVLTTEARVVTIDLDKCWDAERGEWKPIVYEILAWFPDAYVEISNSGTGLHIMFMADVPEGHRCKNAELGMEMYSNHRFVLLTGNGARGRVDVDYSDRMPAFLARYGLEPEPLPAPREGGRSPLWSGPEDDDALITLMLTQGARSAAAMFGDKASVAQIWNMDFAALAASWGTEGRADGLTFDHSAVDMAMMSHLAYFTGGDEPRMVRLFERWPGYRGWKYGRRGGYHIRRVLARAANNPRVLGERQTALVGSGTEHGTGTAAEGEEAPSRMVGEYYAFLPNNTYFHRPTRQFFPAASIDNAVPSIPVGTGVGGMPKTVKATKFLARNHPIHQATWWPGGDEVIENYVMRDGVWSHHPGIRVLNLYQPPTPPQPRGGSVDLWLNHIKMVYPDHWQLLVLWMAFVAQHPTVKVNWAVVLGGAQGIGKDAMIKPLRRVVGEWNCREISPETILTSNFNEHLQCRLLRINEAKDTGGESKFQFYDRTKTIITSPPEVHAINPKGKPGYIIPNLNATLITTNYKVGGMYLPADDRRHLVLWSEIVRTYFNAAYWDYYWHWLDSGGIEDCAHYLMTLDVSGFNPKAAPIQTQAFWEMVDSGHSSEMGDLRDVLEHIKTEKFTLAQLAATARMDCANPDLSDWLKDKKNGTRIARALNDAGVVRDWNHDRDDGRHRIDGKPVTLYKRTR